MTLWLGLLLCALGHTVKAENSFIAVCQRPWTEVHRYTKGSPVPEEPSHELRADILVGKPVRVTLKQGTRVEALNLDNVNMYNGVICGESVDRMSSPVNASAALQPILVCTDGHVSHLHVAAGAREAGPRAEDLVLDHISFKTRDMHPDNAPCVSHYLDGSSTGTGDVGIKRAAAKSELRGVMRDRGYAFTMDNTHVDSGTAHVSGQSLSHVATVYRDGGMRWRGAPYHWLSSWDTSGRRDSARFSVGDLKPIKHTNDFVALQWYNDVCWQTVFVHDETGKRVEGDIETLKMFIRMGHRVRVNLDGFTLEAESVLISPDGVIVAQTSREMARRGGGGPDRTFFNTKTRRMWRLVQTTGMVQTLWFFIQNGKLSEHSKEHHQVSWSVDTRPWTKVLMQNSTNDVIYGDLNSLKNVIATDSIRVKMELEEKTPKGQPPAPRQVEMFLSVSSVLSPDVTSQDADVIAQSLNTAPFYRNKQGIEYHLPLYLPPRQYLEVSTKRGAIATHFAMDTKAFEGSTRLPSNCITWFKDGGL